MLKQPNGQAIVIPVLAGQNNDGGSAFGQPDTPLAESPPFPASLRARYEFLVSDYLFENGNQFVTAETINRPRTAGVRFGYKF